MPETPRKRQNTALRRKQIVGTLRRIMIRSGSDQLTVKKLAEEIGLSPGAIYKHFKSKREVLQFLVADIENKLIGGLANADSLGNPTELLGRISRDLLSRNEQKRGASFLVIAEIISLGDKELNRKISAVIINFHERIKQLISEGIKSGEIREDIDVDLAATTYFGMHQGLATFWSLSGFSPTLKVKTESMWQFYFKAIKKEGAQSSA